MTSRTTEAEVEAPGEAPSSAAREPSAEVTTSVPNWIMPSTSLVRLMIWTRWPALRSSQSSSRASGKYSRRASIRWAGDSSTWPMR